MAIDDFGPKRPMRSTGRIWAGFVTAGIVIAACGSAPDEPTSVEPCAALVAEAASAREIDDQIELFDRALSVCRSVESFAVELARYPGAVGVTAEELVRRRCSLNTDLAATSTCRSIAPAIADTLPPGEDSGSYVGLTLDDREIEISPSLTRFVDDRPAAVAEIDAAAGRGCEGLLAEYVRWFTRTTNPVTGDEASVYARYALDLMRGAGCPPPD